MVICGFHSGDSGHLQVSSHWFLDLVCQGVSVTLCTWNVSFMHHACTCALNLLQGEPRFIIGRSHDQYFPFRHSATYPIEILHSRLYACEWLFAVMGTEVWFSELGECLKFRGWISTHQTKISAITLIPEISKGLTMCKHFHEAAHSGQSNYNPWCALPICTWNMTCGILIYHVNIIHKKSQYEIKPNSVSLSFNGQCRFLKGLDQRAPTSLTFSCQWVHSAHIISWMRNINAVKGLSKPPW